MERTLDIGGAFSGGLAAWRANLRSYTVVGAIASLILGVVTVIIVESFNRSGSVGSRTIVSAIGFALTFMVSALVQGMLIFGASDARAGRPVSIGSMYSQANPVLFALAGTSVLAGLGIGVGIVLLLIPGLILGVWWLFIAPVVVLERLAGVEALRRSREIVRGNAWRVFGLSLLLEIGIAIVSGIAGAILRSAFGYDVGTIVTDTVIGAVTTPVVALIYLAAYLQLTGADYGIDGSDATASDVPPPGFTY